MQARQVVFVVFALLACILCGLLRILMDPLQGFFAGAPFYLLLFWLWVLATTAVAFYASYRPKAAKTAKGAEAPHEPLTGSIALGLTAILLGCVVAISAYQGACVAIARIGANVPKVGFLFFSSMLAIPASLSFIVLGVRYLKKEPTTLSGVALSCAMLWLVGQFCDRVNSFLVISRVLEQQFFILFSLFGIAFLYTHAKLLGDVLLQKKEQPIFFGLMTTLFAALYGVLVLPQTRGEQMPLWVGALGLYAAVFSLRPQTQAKRKQ